MRFFIFIVTYLLLACNQQAENNDSRNDSTGENGTEAGAHRDQFSQLFPVLNAYLQQDSLYTASDFEDQGFRDSSRLATPALLNEDALSDYKALLIYNSDSSKALDLYSYNYIQSNKGGLTTWVRGEADTEVALIDFNNKTRQRIFFAGPSYAVLDATWRGNDSIALAVAAVIEDQKAQPALIKIDIRTRIQEMIYYRDTLRLDAHKYIEQRLNSAKTNRAF